MSGPDPTGTVQWIWRRGVLCMLGVALLCLRAWPRLVDPEVWNEDGTQNLPGVLSRGLADVLQPVNGYFNTSSKLITLVSTWISISQYPLVSTLLAWAVIVWVFVVIATARVSLRGGTLLAIACLLVPSDPEVFGLPLYVFWWLALLLFLFVFWEGAGGIPWLRIPATALAGLSSPVGVVLTPLSWYRVWCRPRDRGEWAVAAVATACASVQTAVMRGQSAPVGGAFDPSVLHEVIPRFLGGYLVGSLAPRFQAIAGLAVLVVAVVALARDPASRPKWLVAMLWCAAVFLSISRVPIGIVHPVHAGPRYFFYPFVLTSWFLLQIAFTGPTRILRAVAWMLLACGVVNSLPALARRHDALDWRRHIASTQHFDTYAIPVHYAGSAGDVWHTYLPRDRVASLLAADPFKGDLANDPGLPFRVLRGADPSVVTVDERRLVTGGAWTGHDLPSGDSIDADVRCSYVSSDADTGEIRLALKRGDRVLYRAGPNPRRQFVGVEDTAFPLTTVAGASALWLVLDFSSDLLPPEFTVTFSDRGGGWGEWSAVALARARR